MKPLWRLVDDGGVAQVTGTELYIISEFTIDLYFLKPHHLYAMILLI